jgi:hypothetical protein
MTDRELRAHSRQVYFLGALLLSAILGLAAVNGAIWMFPVIAGVSVAISAA